MLPTVYRVLLMYRHRLWIPHIIEPMNRRILLLRYYSFDYNCY